MNRNQRNNLKPVIATRYVGFVCRTCIVENGNDTRLKDAVYAVNDKQKLVIPKN